MFGGRKGKNYNNPCLEEGITETIMRDYNPCVEGMKSEKDYDNFFYYFLFLKINTNVLFKKFILSIQYTNIRILFTKI